MQNFSAVYFCNDSLSQKIGKIHRLCILHSHACAFTDSDFQRQPQCNARPRVSLSHQQWNWKSWVQEG